MNFNPKIVLHNRFDIEIRDAISKKLKQSYVTYNIILDRIYTSLCGGYGYFGAITFGGGTGALAANRTGMFSYIGGKSATLVEAIKTVDAQNMRVKKKIELLSTENIGAVITEVSVATGVANSGIVTHALIKDAEGNPISITKTATDQITIYATIYASINLDSGWQFNNLPNNNILVNLLIDGTTITEKYIQVGSSDKPIPIDVDINNVLSGSYGCHIPIASKSYTITNDSANKKMVFNIPRFETAEANSIIRELSINKIARVILPAEDVFSNFSFIGKAIGMSDGIITDFALPYGHPKAGTLKIYADGTLLIKDVDYTVADGFAYGEVITLYDNIISSFIYNSYNGVGPYLYAYDKPWLGSANDGSIRNYIYFNHNINEPMKGIRLVLDGTYSGLAIGAYTLYGSNDGANWTNIGSGNSSVYSGTVDLNFSTPQNYSWYKITFSSEGKHLKAIRLLSANYNLHFINLPANGVAITADYDVEYLPKNSDYVLDLTGSILFGEAV